MPLGVILLLAALQTIPGELYDAGRVDGSSAGQLFRYVTLPWLAQPLLVLEPLLAARTRRGGRIALAGILDAQAGEVAGAYGAHFDARVAAHEEGWSLVAGRRR